MGTEFGVLSTGFGLSGEWRKSHTDADLNYTLYLVTDSSPQILGDRDLCDVVEQAIKGGVTIVQLREKNCDTREFIEKARRLHAITKKYDVPLLINDRIDVALAVNCEGVHIGQDDMDIHEARRLLGPWAIIGVTVSTVEEAIKAAKDGANYLGIGTIYATSTKKDTKHIIGTAGVARILSALHKAGHPVDCVGIGGINESNVHRIVYQSAVDRDRIFLKGVAVVSAIMAAPDPQAAAKRLKEKMTSVPPYGVDVPSYIADTTEKVLAEVPSVITAVDANTPLSHNMTNLVVQNFAANVALAIGASPIMSNCGDEAADLSKLGGSLVINMGTVDDDALANYIKAVRAYNAVDRPVIFDPVGAGATTIRRQAVKTLLHECYFDVIKGNEGEIRTVFGDSDVQQRGVDSTSTLDETAKATLVRALAKREKNVVVMTGKTDYVSDGINTYAVENGHPYLGLVTGTGCTLGTAISAAVAKRTTYGRIVHVIAALLHFEIAAELAAERADVKGPGTFLPAFLDELYRIRKDTVEENLEWLQRAKVRKIELRD